VIKAEHDLLGTEGGKGGEMTQKMYAHVNKKKNTLEMNTVMQ
jgi:hypothetical protein